MPLRYSFVVFAVILALCFLALAETGQPQQVTGFVIDSACAFTKGLDKPISRDCAIKCAKAGSPLIILSDDRTVYWPISDAEPAVGQNARLLPFAGQHVKVDGRVYDRGGSKAIVIQKIHEVAKK